MPRSGPGADTSLPSTSTTPAVGLKNPATMCNSVVFPQPDGPTSVTISRSPTLKETSSSARTGVPCSRYSYMTSWTSILVRGATAANSLSAIPAKSLLISDPAIPPRQDRSCATTWTDDNDRPIDHDCSPLRELRIHRVDLDCPNQEPLALTKRCVELAHELVPARLGALVVARLPPRLVGCARYSWYHATLSFIIRSKKGDRYISKFNASSKTTSFFVF